MGKCNPFRLAKVVVWTVKVLVQLFKDHDRLLEMKATPAEKFHDYIIMVLGIGTGFSVAMAIFCR